MSVYGIPISQSFGTLEKYQGGFILVVNIADQCGFSPQLKDLELLHAHPNNLCQVMAFPSDQFNQQSKDDAQMQSWCQVQKLSFFVSPVVSVNGEFTHPLFAYLKKEGSFIDSYAVVVGCRCIAYSIQERASQDPCSQVASPGVISRKDARRHGLTNY